MAASAYAVLAVSVSLIIRARKRRLQWIMHDGALTRLDYRIFGPSCGAACGLWRLEFVVLNPIVLRLSCRFHCTFGCLPIRL